MPLGAASGRQTCPSANAAQPGRRLPWTLAARPRGARASGGWVGLKLPRLPSDDRSARQGWKVTTAAAGHPVKVQTWSQGRSGASRVNEDSSDEQGSISQDLPNAFAEPDRQKWNWSVESVPGSRFKRSRGMPQSPPRPPRPRPAARDRAERSRCSLAARPSPRSRFNAPVAHEREDAGVLRISEMANLTSVGGSTAQWRCVRNGGGHAGQQRQRRLSPSTFIRFLPPRSCMVVYNSNVHANSIDETETVIQSEECTLVCTRAS